MNASNPGHRNWRSEGRAGEGVSVSESWKGWGADVAHPDSPAGGGGPGGFGRAGTIKGREILVAQGGKLELDAPFSRRTRAPQSPASDQPTIAGVAEVRCRRNSSMW